MVPQRPEDKEEAAEAEREDRVAPRGGEGLGAGPSDQLPGLVHLAPEVLGDSDAHLDLREVRGEDGHRLQEGAGGEGNSTRSTCAP